MEHESQCGGGLLQVPVGEEGRVKVKYSRIMVENCKCLLSGVWQNSAFCLREAQILHNRSRKRKPDFGSFNKLCLVLVQEAFILGGVEDFQTFSGHKSEYGVVNLKIQMVVGCLLCRISQLLSFATTLCTQESSALGLPDFPLDSLSSIVKILVGPCKCAEISSVNLQLFIK